MTCTSVGLGLWPLHACYSIYFFHAILSFCSGLEPQVLDFVTQQYKLFPVLSEAYAFSAVGLHLRNLYYSVNYDIQKGNVELLAEVSKSHTVLLLLLVNSQLSTHSINGPSSTEFVFVSFQIHFMKNLILCFFCF